MRCLKQHAQEEGKEFPLATKAFMNIFFMDDLLTGSDTIEEAAELCQQLSRLLLRGQFSIRKWRSNDLRVLENLPKENLVEKFLILDEDEPLKTLGLLWNAKTDTFQYEVTLKKEKKLTKRRILSCIAQIFDPLGLIGPMTTNRKILMQNLWILRLQWDEIVPDAI